MRPVATAQPMTEEAWVMILFTEDGLRPSAKRASRSPTKVALECFAMSASLRCPAMVLVQLSQFFKVLADRSPPRSALKAS
ncbi:hypothetical protein D3C75_1220050 [compost metagenome]